MTQNPNNPEEFEEWFNALTIEEQAEYIGSLEIHSGPTEYIPDEELDDLEYYGRHGYSRTAPTCDDPDCLCED